MSKNVWKRMEALKIVWKRLKAYESVWKHMKAYESVWKRINDCYAFNELGFVTGENGENGFCRDPLPPVILIEMRRLYVCL